MPVPSSSRRTERFRAMERSAPSTRSRSAPDGGGSQARSLHGTTVRGLAAAAGVTPDVVRYYSRIGLLEPLRNPDNNYKCFNGHHLARLKFIRGAQALGYTLTEIQRIFGHAEDGHSPCPEVRDILRRRIDETRAQLGELQELVQRMERALRNWEKMKDGTPDGHSVCVLIESTLTGGVMPMGAHAGDRRVRKNSGRTRNKTK